MKKILLFGAIALSTFTFGQNIPSYVPTNGLVGWWPFNGNANDESGNGNNGTVTDATLTLDRNSVSNSAYNFDYAGYSNGQIDDIILIPHNSSFSTTEMSISFWFKDDLYDYSGNPGHSAIIKRVENGYSNPPGEFWYSILDASSKKITCGVIDENRNGISVSSSNNSINLNTWYHVVMTYDNIELKLYLDGTLVDQISKTNGLRTTGTSGISIGVSKQANGYWRPFDGIIDDFGLWNIGLTSQEVTDLYNASTCQTPTSTITPQGNTTFCQGSSVVLEATSGSNYTYLWYKNGNAINGETNQTYTATTSGNYTVKVIDGTCDATSSATTVAVNSNPTVSFTLSSMISNDNGNVTLNGSPSGGTYTGNGITGITLDPSSVGLGKQTIVYDYTDNNGCSGSQTATTIIYDTTGTVCSTYDTTFVTIDVYDTTFVTQTIYDTITIENHISVTDTLIIDVSLAGLNPPNNINTMKVYPNPSNDIVNIDNGDYALMNGYSIKIINALGQEKFNNAINIPAFQIPVSQLGAIGVYYINIYDNQSQLVESKVLVLE